MSRLLTCTWAPTVLRPPRLIRRSAKSADANPAEPTADELNRRLLEPVLLAERLGIDALLVAQRWWGSGKEIEGSSFDCTAMTAFYAAHTRRLRLVTAIHPGFFLPAPIAKWGASLDRITGGRWSINVTSGWNLEEFGMYGAQLLEHDERYARSAEFIEILRGAWSGESFSYAGSYYQVDELCLEPRPHSPLEVYQGGQSPAAIAMAARHSDWMFLNGGPPEKVGDLISTARAAAARQGRELRFALYGIPVCRETDGEAEAAVAAMVEAADPELVARRRERVDGAEGMWARSDDPLTTLDTNEGLATRLIGSPATVLERVRELRRLGVDCLHLTLGDRLFNEKVLPSFDEV
ncbi:MAG: LLM class flavin-dependent oxidoreductase [Acidobacteriota bacterium]|nr:LLM class flavin-dependent oxidoreductase [Acidobacteriota bacterium]